MSESEFEENARLFEAGQMSRRRFINRMVAGGASMAAAIAFVNASPSGAFAAPRSGDIYGTPPGRGGTPPGQGGTAPGQAKKNGSASNVYGTPPGHLGTPRGHI